MMSYITMLFLLLAHCRKDGVSDVCCGALEMACPVQAPYPQCFAVTQAATVHTRRQADFSQQRRFVQNCEAKRFLTLGDSITENTALLKHFKFPPNNLAF